MKILKTFNSSENFIFKLTILNILPLKTNQLYVNLKLPLSWSKNRWQEIPVIDKKIDKLEQELLESINVRSLANRKFPRKRQIIDKSGNTSSPKTESSMKPLRTSKNKTVIEPLLKWFYGFRIPQALVFSYSRSTSTSKSITLQFNQLKFRTFFKQKK